MVRASQAAGYLPPTANRWQTMSAQNAYTGGEFASPSPAVYPVAFRHIQSGIVLLDAPSDWQPMASMGDNISFASHEGESFGFGKVSRLLPEHLRKPGIAGSPSSIPDRDRL